MCAGLHIIDSLIYAATTQGLVGMSLVDSAETVFSLFIPGMQFLNDVTSDNNGIIYVTDSDGNKVYKVNPTDSTYETIVESGIINYPNGIIFEEETNTLIICSELGNISPIYRVTLSNYDVSLMFNGLYRGADGISRDRLGNYYICAGLDNNIYKYDHDFAEPEVLFSSGHSNPADIYCNNFDDILAVPNLGAPQVDFIPLNLVGINENNILTDYTLTQNYPNPFNPTTTISYQLPKNGKVEITVYNLKGQKVKTLINETLESGNHSVIWEGTDENGKSVSSGIYLYNLKINYESVAMKRMVLIK